MRRYTLRDIEALTNWDGLLCKPPWRNDAQKRQYYGRHIERMLWRYFTHEDWTNLAQISDALRVSEKLKATTKHLVNHHLGRKKGT